ncbi:HEAT repeat domain-containing protein [Crocinitomicaceae bacterium CZZ-1]|uniref:Aminopeptidase N n=1 Tax=Taishania pollutisoli TaxID=2766479 RepID=A0A8J6P599_9FLAO|nr:M1 family aminopeptidase [Taishania pollutisoli]MBC9812034.1 HEAT repeat domain-containing protein [Taishania pollutisoli]MBX2949890.1 HEAT repeat domain-containing protein [Crocinitomicaceae bacterium]NGF74809.1 M1 family peptidase [Fluviicola sp. SGL-29]
MRKSYFAVALLVLTACGAKKTDAPISPVATVPTPPPTTEVAEPSKSIPTERAVFHASETILTNLIHTRLDVNVDWAKAYLYGKATITAKPHFYPSDSLILDAKGMTINSVKLDGKDLTYTYKDDFLKIKLGKTYTRNEQYTIVVDYIAKPNERKTGGSAAITSDKGLYFINNDGSEANKMPQIWTQGETEASSVWFPTIDAPNAKTSQEIFVTVEDKFVTLSNGKLVSSKKNTDGTRTDHWKQELPHAPYLFMLGIGEFKIVKDTYTRKDGKKIDVHYYVEPEWEKYAKSIFGHTPEMIQFFSEKLGVEYPWDKYHQIVVRDYVSGAMENTGAVVFGDFVYKTDRESLDGTSESIIAHELFHHWFGDLVTCESWSNLPLNEAFANYSQYLWDEYKHGKDEADFHASSEANGYLQQAQMQGYHDLIWYDYDEKEEMFDGHSYNKGGRILHMLRSYVGDEAFFLSLNKYLTDNKYKAAEYHHLRLAFEEVTGEDLNWFFQQWFTASGHPTLDINQREENGQVIVSIAQKQNLAEFPIFKLPMQIAVVDSEGKQVHNVTVDKIENEFRFPVRGTLKTVITDYQEALLAEVNEKKPQAQFVEQYYNSEKWRTRTRALNFGTKKIDETAQKLILDALKDPFWSIRSTAIEKAVRLKDANKQQAIELIKALATSDPESSVRAAALNFIDRMGVENAESIYLASLKDSSYSVVSSALKYLGKVNPTLAMQKAAELENERSTNMIVGIAGLYAENGDAGKFSFFQKNLTNGTMSGFDELGMMNLFTSYLSGQDNALMEQSFDTYNYLKNSGGMYTKMFFPQNVDFLLQQIDVRLNAEKAVLAEVEKNKDNAGIVKAEKNIKQLEELSKKFKGLKD